MNQRTYIEALVNSIKKDFEINWKPDIILASYHGIPKNILIKATRIIVIAKNLKVNLRKIQRNKNNNISVGWTPEWLQPYG